MGCCVEYPVAPWQVYYQLAIVRKYDCKLFWYLFQVLPGILFTIGTCQINIKISFEKLAELEPELQIVSLHSMIIRYQDYVPVFFLQHSGNEKIQTRPGFDIAGIVNIAIINRNIFHTSQSNKVKHPFGLFFKIRDAAKTPKKPGKEQTKVLIHWISRIC